MLTKNCTNPVAAYIKGDICAVGDSVAAVPQIASGTNTSTWPDDCHIQPHQKPWGRGGGPVSAPDPLKTADGLHHLYMKIAVM